MRALRVQFPSTVDLLASKVSSPHCLLTFCSWSPQFSEAGKRRGPGIATHIQRCYESHARIRPPTVALLVRFLCFNDIPSDPLKLNCFSTLPPSTYPCLCRPWATADPYHAHKHMAPPSHVASNHTCAQRHAPILNHNVFLVRVR